MVFWYDSLEYDFKENLVNGSILKCDSKENSVTIPRILPRNVICLEVTYIWKIFLEFHEYVLYLKNN